VHKHRSRRYWQSRRVCVCMWIFRRRRYIGGRGVYTGKHMHLYNVQIIMYCVLFITFATDTITHAFVLHVVIIILNYNIITTTVFKLHEARPRVERELKTCTAGAERFGRKYAPRKFSSEDSEKRGERFSTGHVVRKRFWLFFSETASEPAETEVWSFLRIPSFERARPFFSPFSNRTYYKNMCKIFKTNQECIKYTST